MCKYCFSEDSNESFQRGNTELVIRFNGTANVWELVVMYFGQREASIVTFPIKFCPVCGEEKKGKE